MKVTLKTLEDCSIQLEKAAKQFEENVKIGAKIFNCVEKNLNELLDITSKQKNMENKIDNL